MKAHTPFVLTIFLVSIKSSSQPIKISEFGISQLFLWNKTAIFDAYSGARSSRKTGQAWSYGTNINYSHSFYKNVYANIGLGYFHQRFGIHRGFDFEEPTTATGLFYNTDNYSYKTLQYFGGLGYSKRIARQNKKIIPGNSEIRLLVLYNIFNTYQQMFQHEFEGNFLNNPNPQIRKSKYYYGSSLTVKGGLVSPVVKRIKVGIDLVVPVYNRWRKDAIFREDPDKYHGTDFSFGTSINFIYDLN
ncbi:MAG: hypothetical protein ABWZ25_04715 [Chitinophagaceae bacterium]